MSADGKGPALIRLTVPRLEGHSFQDTQTYKSDETVKAEWARDPLPKLKAFADHLDWELIEASVAAGRREGARARPRRAACRRPPTSRKHVFFEGAASEVGGGAGLSLDGTTEEAAPEGQRINMVTAIRRVLDQELEANPQGAGVRRGCRAQGRGPCGHARAAGQVWPRPRVRHLASTRKGSSAARWGWRSPG